MTTAVPFGEPFNVLVRRGIKVLNYEETGQQKSIGENGIEKSKIMRDSVSKPVTASKQDKNAEESGEPSVKKQKEAEVVISTQEVLKLKQAWRIKSKAATRKTRAKPTGQASTHRYSCSSFVDYY